MELNVTALTSKTSPSVINVTEKIFNKKYNTALIHQACTAYMAGARQGSKAQKNRSEVSGGGAKPWKQKGTGRARAGSIRSPLFRKGGVVFAAKPKNYAQKINKKMYRAAMQSILSEILRTNKLIIINELKISQPKTKEAILILNKLNINNALFIISKKEINQTIYLSIKNIKNINIIDTFKINPVQLIKYHKIIITQDAIKEIEGYLI